MQRGVEAAKTYDVKPMKKMVGPYAPEARQNPRTNLVSLNYVVFVAISCFFMGIMVALLAFISLT